MLPSGFHLLNKLQNIALDIPRLLCAPVHQALFLLGVDSVVPAVIRLAFDIVALFKRHNIPVLAVMVDCAEYLSFHCDYSSLFFLLYFIFDFSETRLVLFGEQLLIGVHNAINRDRHLDLVIADSMPSDSENCLRPCERTQINRAAMIAPPIHTPKNKLCGFPQRLLIHHRSSLNQRTNIRL
nr:MAG TPA: hypothetical protein [Caudoviricetes sp.]